MLTDWSAAWKVASGVPFTVSSIDGASVFGAEWTHAASTTAAPTTKYLTFRISG